MHVPKRILVGVDFSSCSRAALKRASELHQAAIVRSSSSQKNAEIRMSEKVVRLANRPVLTVRERKA